MKFDRINLKSVSNCTQVYIDLIIGFLFLIAMSSFGDMDDSVDGHS